MDRTQQILDLYRQGDTLISIGNRFGISKQRVWQIIKPRYQELADDGVDRPHHCERNTTTSRPAELYVYGKLKSLGVDFQPTNYCAPYDAIVNGKKVEIKHRSLPKRTKIEGHDYWFYNFNYLKPKTPIDCYIFVCGDLNRSPKCYIYEASKVKNYKRIPSQHLYKGTSRRYKEYLERWDKLK